MQGDFETFQPNTNTYYEAQNMNLPPRSDARWYMNMMPNSDTRRDIMLGVIMVMTVVVGSAALVAIGYFLAYLQLIINIGDDIARGVAILERGENQILDALEKNNIDGAHVLDLFFSELSDEDIATYMLDGVETGRSIMRTVRFVEESGSVEYISVLLDLGTDLASSDAAPIVLDSTGKLINFVADHAENGNVATGAALVRTVALAGLNVTQSPHFARALDRLEGTVTIILEDEAVRRTLNSTADVMDNFRNITRRLSTMVVGPRSDHVIERSYTMFEQVTEGPYMDELVDSGRMLVTGGAAFLKQVIDTKTLEKFGIFVDTAANATRLATDLSEHSILQISLPHLGPSKPPQDAHAPLPQAA